MADNNITPPPAPSAIDSAKITPSPASKRLRTTSPPKTAAPHGQDGTQGTASGQNLAAETADDLDIQAEDDNDSAFGTDNSDTTSIASSFYHGYVKNGRRYQTLRDEEYWGPSDEKQFESMNSGHIVRYLLDSKAENPLFQSPLQSTAQNILDVGTGTGIWATEVADRFPSATVTGIDLYPPPETWVPPNCKLEVDDVLKTWNFRQSFDLIHLRDMVGSFTDEQWRLLYKQAYRNLVPGGWIEQYESCLILKSDDGTLNKDSVLYQWGPMMIKCIAKSGRRGDIEETFKDSIAAAGFTNARQKQYKVPIGDWAKDPLLKEVGRLRKAEILAGIEGYCMMILTNFGEPEPWSPEEVQIYLAKCREELNDRKIHAYQRFTRIWAQKPFDAEPAAKKPEVDVENLA